MSTDSHSYKNRKYSIVQYDPNWPDQFNIYANNIRTIFGENIQIEHIGSTAVPGMSGKPCIDVLVIVNNLDSVSEHVTDMEKAGFEYAGQFVTKDSYLFRIMKNNMLLANIHFFPKDHPHNKEMIAVRDYLRIHPDEARTYSTIKNNLYMKYTDDYATYRKYKDEYMGTLMKKVL